MLSFLNKQKKVAYLALFIAVFVAINFQIANADWPQPSGGGGGGNNPSNNSGSGGGESFDWNAFSASSNPDVRSCPINNATYVDNGNGTWSRYDSSGNSTGNVSNSFVSQHGTASGAGSGCSSGCSGGSSSTGGSSGSK